MFYLDLTQENFISCQNGLWFILYTQLWIDVIYGFPKFLKIRIIIISGTIAYYRNLEWSIWPIQTTFFVSTEQSRNRRITLHSWIAELHRGFVFMVASQKSSWEHYSELQIPVNIMPKNVLIRAPIIMMLFLTFKQIEVRGK